MSYLSDNISLVRANTVTTSFDSGNVNENTVNAYANLFFPYVQDNAGNNKIVSLTIDVLNKNTIQDESSFPNKNWVNKDRDSANILDFKPIWGFKECYHGVKKSNALSNAFVFGGQVVNFYIAKQGHDVGYIDDIWIYCKTKITITATNVVNGTDTVLHSFEGFELDKDDTSRYFSWQVPEIDNDIYADYGLFGLVVIKLEIQNTYYTNAEKTILYTNSEPNTIQSYLQVLIYSGPKEIIEISAGPANILKSIPYYYESLEEIFDYTIFSDWESLNLNGLTYDQKRAIIADQIAVIFISQHMVITADFYPSKVIGIGGEESIPPRKIITKAINYIKKYPDVIPLFKDRLFGMFANYKYFNFMVDLEKIIPDYDQSSQLIRDPQRTIIIDENNVINTDLGIDGISFNPYILDVSNAEIIFKTEDIQQEIKLYNGNIDIGNIQVTSSTGSTIQPYDIFARVSFDVNYGDTLISKIRYNIITFLSRNYATYLDSTGLTRSHIFTLNNGIIPDPVTNGDIVTIQIDIEDIYGTINSFVRDIYLNGYAQRPALTNLKIYQRNDGSGVVDIMYNYIESQEINNAYLYVQFSNDNGVTWSNIATNSLKGDFGNNVLPGLKVVSWKPLLDLSEEDLLLEEPILCRLTLYNVDKTKALGQSLTGVLVWDLTKPEIAVRKLSLEES